MAGVRDERRYQGKENNAVLCTQSIYASLSPSWAGPSPTTCRSGLVSNKNFIQPQDYKSGIGTLAPLCTVYPGNQVPTTCSSAACDLNTETCADLMFLKPSVHRLLWSDYFTLGPTDPVVPLDASILNVPSLQEFRTALNTTLKIPIFDTPPTPVSMSTRDFISLHDAAAAAQSSHRKVLAAGRAALTASPGKVLDFLASGFGL
ncbi:hypothetical protein N7474_000617 [Penicillium riverlandense]|uniref:uncharacterized protein n=1 Tax=Penicillium riverlandense TaxID=1903569 RepID=UPI0025467801|nr:uncharacterized protein N7474_000617 [Penicillium riverlandense]KAJ5832306.1 hypothetical protein N7474_000617 [Penicillium riverlandense]